MSCRGLVRLWELSHWMAGPLIPKQFRPGGINEDFAEEIPHQPRTVHISPKGDSSSIYDFSPLTIEKSNVLCLGPTGVGKTLMLRTLARVLEVPFSM